MRVVNPLVVVNDAINRWWPPAEDDPDAAPPSRFHSIAVRVVAGVVLGAILLTVLR
jgi:hypothetical protein